LSTVHEYAYFFWIHLENGLLFITTGVVPGTFMIPERTFYCPGICSLLTGLVIVLIHWLEFWRFVIAWLADVADGFVKKFPISSCRWTNMFSMATILKGIRPPTAPILSRFSEPSSPNLTCSPSPFLFPCLLTVSLFLTDIKLLTNFLSVQYIVIVLKVPLSRNQPSADKHFWQCVSLF